MVRRRRNSADKTASFPGWLDPAPVPEVDPASLSQIIQIRLAFESAIAHANREIAGARDIEGIQRAVARTRDRCCQIETRLSDVEQTLDRLVERRADLVRDERGIVAALRGAMVELLGDEELWREVCDRAGIEPERRGMADPSALSEAMRDPREEEEEPNAAIAGLLHGWDERAIEADPDFEGLDFDFQ